MDTRDTLHRRCRTIIANHGRRARAASSRLDACFIGRLRGQAVPEGPGREEATTKMVAEQRWNDARL
ncbi:MAG: hypothetical protein K2W96_02575 [Gemmataceae bacterium]|nr:hypothetical protein [Gemmataceae bacterium]